jgi:hypothetical protein
MGSFCYRRQMDQTTRMNVLVPDPPTHQGGDE